MTENDSYANRRMNRVTNKSHAVECQSSQSARNGLGYGPYSQRMSRFIWPPRDSAPL